MSTGKSKLLMQQFSLSRAMSYLEGNPEENIPKLMDLVDKASPDGWIEGQRAAFRKAIKEKNNWYDLILRVYKINPGLRKKIMNNLIFNATLKGGMLQKTFAEEYACNIPWAILLDPTSECNMACKGCWSAEYGNHMNMDYRTMNTIVRQGRHLGTYIYLFTGGEPLLRKDDIIRLCMNHHDCMFMAFTNGTLINYEICRDMLALKNLLLTISIDGFESSNDERRGKGSFQKAKEKMRLMKEYGLPFGISTCYTSRNIDDVSSEEYFDMMINSGAYFVWFFHYMPTGSNADVSLLPTPEQREKMYRRINEYRQKKPIFSIDFQNDGKYAGGCIAGGRKYLHINAAGDIEPCAFIHYADSNIHEHTLLESFQRPLFRAYHDLQPFNENMFRPCPMLENPEIIEQIISKNDVRNTDLVAPEPITQLCSKTKPYAEAWTETADRLWEEAKQPHVYSK